jgi:60 kDa SS-A/Ro ribonucleoprotein
MAKYDQIAEQVRASKKLTSPQEKIKGREKEQKKNAAGGVSFKMDHFDRLNRFLIIGVEGNTFYQSQKELVKENVKCLTKCLEKDPMRVIDMVVHVSTNNLAFKQDPALFVLASAASYKVDQNGIGNDVRQYALSNLPLVARTGAALYTFAQFVQAQRGWGRSLRRAFNDWLNKTPVDKLAYQSWKYKQRNGWTYRDVMRLTHPITDDPVRSEIFKYMARPDESPIRGSITEDMNQDIFTSTGKPRVAYPSLLQIWAADRLQRMSGATKKEVSEAVKLIVDHRLTHEAIPTQLRKSKEIWDALLNNMPMTAALRNLGVMTNINLITPGSNAEKKVVDLFSNKEVIANSRTHPIQFLIAAKQYSVGAGNLGNLTWSPSQNILDTLDDAFYTSFGNVPSTGKRILVAVDVSGSMTYGYIMGIRGWTPLMLSSAMALITYKVEPNAEFIGFDTNIRNLVMNRKDRIDTVNKRFEKYSGGGTNTSLPIKHANRYGPYDAVVSYTDNETWHHFGGWNSSGHVTEHVNQYVNKHGPVRFLNCATLTSGTSDVDPENPYMFELCGFSADTPKIISEYIAGNL